MVSKNELRVGLKFETDTSQLEMSKQKLGELISGLQQVQNQVKNTSFTGKISEDFKKAAEEAKQLEQILNNSWNSKLGQLDLTKFKQQLIESNKTMVQVKANLAGAGTMGTDSFNKVASSILNTNTQLKQTSTLLEKMSLTMANTIRFGISSSVFNSFTGSIQKAYDYVKKLDKSLNDIRIVSNASAADMEKFARYANTAAQKLGASTLDYTKAALIYYQQGLDEEQVKLRSDITVKMANVLGDSAQQVSDYMTAIWNNFADGSQNLEYYADVLAKLGAETASSAEEISQGLEKFAAVGKTVGLSYDYAAAALTTVTDRTRQSADVVGTAFKTLFARIQDLELGDEGAVSIGKYSEALEKFNIHVLDSDGNLKKMDSILDEMGSKWKTMSDAQKVALAQNVAGVRQYTQLMSLMENWDFFQQNVDSARDATGALQKQQEIYLDSVEAHLEQLSAEAEKMYSSLLDEDAIKSFTDLLIGALKTVNTYLTGLGGGLNGLATLGANAATLFSKQIAGAVNRGLENRELEKKRQNEGAFKEELAQNIQTNYKLEGTSASEERVKAEADVALEISKIEKDISEEKYNQLTAIQKQIGENTEVIAQLNNWKANLKEAGIEEKDSLATIKAKEKNLKESNDLYNRQLDIIRKVNNMLGESELNNQKITKAQKEQLAASLKALPGFSKNADLIAKEINQKGKLRKLEDGLIDLQDNLNDKVETNEKHIETINEGLKRKERLEAGEAEQLEQINQEGKNFIDNTVKSTKKINEMQDVITAASLTMSTLTSSVGIFKTMFDPDLSGWEKIQSIFSVAVTQSLLLAKNWDSIKAAGPTIAKWAAERVAVMKAEEAQRMKNIALGEIENTQEATQVALEQAETAENAAQAGFTLKETVLNVLLIVQKGILAALDAVRALLSGNITALGVATVAILAAGVVALGKWIIHLIKVNSEEAKLQKQIEETNEAVEKAKEAYKEITDTISNYKDARSGIDSLTEGTLEFYDAIIKSNEAAQTLIDKLGLLVNQDYTIDKNGLITIKESALENAVFKEQQKIYRAQGDQAKAQTDYAKYQQQKVINDFAASLTKETQNKGFHGIVTSEQAEKILKNSEETKYDIGKLLTTPEDKLNQISMPNSQNQNKNSIAGNRFKEITEGTLNQKKEKASSPSDNTIDISRLMAKYLPAYQQTEAKITNEEKLRAAYNIRGYGSKEQVERYNSLTGRQQDLVNSYVAYENQRIVNAQSSSDLSTNELKEKYAINALGYKYTQDKQNLMNSNGLVLSDSDYDTLMDSIDKKTAKRAYDNGAYRASQDAEKVLKALETNKENALKDKKNGFNETSANYISEVLTGLKYGNLNEETIGKLTDKEKSYLRDQIQKGNEEAAKADKEANDGITSNPWKYTSEQIDEWLAASDQVGKSFERLKEEAKDYHNELDSQAKALGTTAEALDFYAIAMDNAAGVQHQQNAETAKAAAEQYKFNKSYNDARKVYSDNAKAIKAYAKAQKNHQKISYDLADAMGELSQSLKAMGLSLSGESITKHLGLIRKLLTGTEKQAEDAYKKLYKIGQMDTMKKFFGDPKDLKNADERKKKLNEYKEIIKGINAVEPGQNLDEKYAKKLNNMIDQTKLTVEQLRELSSELGIDIPVTLDVPDEFSVDNEEFTVKGSSTLHSYVGNMVNPAYNGDNDLYIPVNYKWVETVEDKTESYMHPTDTNFKVNRNTKNLGNNFKKASTGNGGGGGGKSGKSTPQKAEKFKPERDIYHKINTQITKIDNQLNKLQKTEERVLGTKLLKNYAEQWKRVNTQLDNYKEKLGIAKKEQKDLQDKLKKQGVEFKEDGTVSNYYEKLDALEAEIEKKRKKYNDNRKKASQKTNENRLKEIETLKEKYEEIKEEMERANELASDFIPEIESNIRDALDEQIEINVKAFNVKINYSTDLKELTKEVNDFVEKSLNRLSDDNIYGNFQLNQKNMAASLTKDENGNLSGHLVNSAQYMKDLQEQYKTLTAEGASIFGDNEAKGWDEYHEKFQQFMADYSEYVEYQNNQLNLIREQQEAINELEDKQYDNYNKINDELEHNKKLLELTYGEAAASKIQKILNLQTKNTKEQAIKAKAAKDESITFYNQQQKAYSDFKSQLEILEKAGDTTSDAYKQTYNAMIDAAKAMDNAAETMQERMNTARESVEAVIDAINNELAGAINVIIEDLNKGLTESGKGLDHALDQWDLIDKEAQLYLDTINAMQGEKDLESKYLDSIEKSANPNTQKKLKKIMDEELEALKKKDKLTQYDLDRANKKYQIALAQVALEEAQQNKSTMRLRRDSQGNYRYQYVADQNEIDKAQDKLTQMYTDLYNFDKSRFLEVNNEILDIEKDVQEQIKAVWTDGTLSKEEQQAKIEEIVASSNIRIGELQKQLADNEINLNESAFESLKNLYGENSEEYQKACQDKAAALAELIPQFASEGHEIATNTDLVKANEEAYLAAADAAKEAANQISENIKSLDGQLDDLAKGIDTDIEEINKLIDDGTDRIKGYKAELLQMNADLTNNQGLLDSFNKEYNIVTMVAEAYKGLSEAKEEVFNTTSDTGEGGTEGEGGGDNEPLVTDYHAEDLIIDEPKVPESEPESEPIIQSASTSSTITDKLPKGKLTTKAQKKKLQTFLKGLGYNPGKIDGVWGSNSKKALKKFQKKIGTKQDGIWGKNTWTKAKAAGYDTGGYTGEWGNDGRLAVLHQKELVLNAKDTENILNTVAIMRNLMASLNNNVLSRLAGVSAGSINGLDMGASDSGLEQNVHIEANFPNATNSKEIEDALKNLVNVASQRITK